ncbi:DUF4166 domain-containing protein [Gammaproteobacteria bacterium AS21]
MSEKSVFQLVLGDDWDRLGSIIRRHYFLKPKSVDYICVSGKMSQIHHSNVAKLLIPFGLLFGALVPYRGKDIAVDVHYTSKPNNGNLYWDRVFKFRRGDFHFKSYMEPVKQGEVIEFVRFGIGIRLNVSAEQGALVFRDVGYIWRVLGCDIPIPGRWLMGKVYVEERPIDERFFSMKMTLEHPLLGALFTYRGVFELNQ